MTNIYHYFKDPPQHLLEDVDLARNIVKANALAARNNLTEVDSFGPC